MHTSPTMFKNFVSPSIQAEIVPPVVGVKDIDETLDLWEGVEFTPSETQKKNLLLLYS